MGHFREMLIQGFTGFDIIVNGRYELLAQHQAE